MAQPSVELQSLTVFFGAAFLAVVFLAVAFLAVVFLAGAFLAVVFFVAWRVSITGSDCRESGVCNFM